MTYPFEHFYNLMPEPYKSQLLPEARTPMNEFETACDFLLMGYKWWRLPISIQYWFDVHDRMPYILPKEKWGK